MWLTCAANVNGTLGRRWPLGALEMLGHRLTHHRAQRLFVHGVNLS